jgi:hypothetical protein
MERNARIARVRDNTMSVPKANLTVPITKCIFHAKFTIQHLKTNRFLTRNPQLI